MTTGFDGHCAEIVTSASLTEAAAALGATLAGAGPDAHMWCAVDGGGSAFYARRFAYETA